MSADGIFVFDSQDMGENVLAQALAEIDEPEVGPLGTSLRQYSCPDSFARGPSSCYSRASTHYVAIRETVLTMRCREVGTGLAQL